MKNQSLLYLSLIQSQKQENKNNTMINLSNQQATLIHESKRFPKVTLSASSQLLQCQQKYTIQSKQSDFIKRIKRTKSIILAQKNRKQKHMMNSYFMYSPRKKNKYLEQVNKSQSSILQIKKNKDNFQQQKIQLNLLPPLHASIEALSKQSKRSKKRDIVKNQFSYCDQMSLNNKKINGYIFREKTQFQANKNSPCQLKKLFSEREANMNPRKLQQQIHNYFAIKLHQRQSNTLKQKIKKKVLKINKSDEEDKNKYINHQDILSRWQFKRYEDEHQIIQQNNF